MAPEVSWPYPPRMLAWCLCISLWSLCCTAFPGLCLCMTAWTLALDLPKCTPTRRRSTSWSSHVHQGHWKRHTTLSYGQALRIVAMPMMPWIWDCNKYPWLKVIAQGYWHVSTPQVSPEQCCHFVHGLTTHGVETRSPLIGHQLTWAASPTLCAGKELIIQCPTRSTQPADTHVRAISSQAKASLPCSLVRRQMVKESHWHVSDEEQVFLPNIDFREEEFWPPHSRCWHALEVFCICSTPPQMTLLGLFIRQTCLANKADFGRICTTLTAYLEHVMSESSWQMHAAYGCAQLDVIGQQIHPKLSLVYLSVCGCVRVSLFLSLSIYIYVYTCSYIYTHVYISLSLSISLDPGPSEAVKGQTKSQICGVPLLKMTKRLSPTRSSRPLCSGLQWGVTEDNMQLLSAIPMQVANPTTPLPRVQERDAHKGLQNVTCHVTIS